MVAPLLALHGLLIAGAIVVKTANNVIESFRHQDPTQAMEEALNLDIKAPTDIVSYFITSYDHLHHDDWRGLKPWLSSYNPPKKIYGNAHVLRQQSEDANIPQQYSYCVVAETILMTSVDAIMESMVPKQHNKEIGSSSTSMARRKRAELEHRTTVPFNVCMEWTVAAHADKPKEWTHVALAITVSRIRTIDTTAVRLAILQSEVQPDEIPLLILDLVLQQRVDTLTAMTATIMRWVQKQSEDMVREDAEARSLTAAVKRLIQHVGSVDKVLSEEAKEAIRSNYAQEVLDKIDDLLSAENYTKGWSDGRGESSPKTPETSQPIDNEDSVSPMEHPEKPTEEGQDDLGKAETEVVSALDNSQHGGQSTSKVNGQTDEDQAAANPGARVSSQSLQDTEDDSEESVPDKVPDVEEGKVEPLSDDSVQHFVSKENLQEAQLPVTTKQGVGADKGSRYSGRNGRGNGSPAEVEAELLQKSQVSNQVDSVGYRNEEATGQVSKSNLPTNIQKSSVESENLMHNAAKQESLTPSAVKNVEESRKATIDRSQSKVNFEGPNPDQKRYLLVVVAAGLFLFNFYLCVTR